MANDNKRFCPECGCEAGADERFCKDCGARLPEYVPDTSNSPIIGEGARANVLGGINTTNNTSSSSTNVDNSSTINNTTVIMGSNAVEFCEVCGNSLDGKKARCPKCGKTICQDCKVPGKNRCTECEKKAVEEYRIAYQQLLLESGYEIGGAGRQMINRKARELDIQDRQQEIEQEFRQPLQPKPKFVPQSLVEDTPPSVHTGPEKDDNDKGGSGKGKWIIAVIAVVLIAAAAIYFGVFFRGDASDSHETVTEQENVMPEQPKAVQEPKPVEAAPARQPEKTVTAPVKKDTSYENGMKEYNAGNGLEAVRYFKESASADSYYMLGIIYEKGCGSVSGNAMMSRKYFKKAAEMGNEKAKLKIK